MGNKTKLFSILFYILIILFGFGYSWRGYYFFDELVEFVRSKSPQKKPVSEAKKITADQIFKSKLNEAKIKGSSVLELSDGTIKLGGPQYYEIEGLVNFSAKIIYDAFTEKYQCRLNSQTVDPISKDIKIEIGNCREYKNSRIRCRGKDGFDDYIQYRANGEKNIRRYYPEIIIEDDNRYDRERLGITYTSYKYYKVLPYSFFKDFEKIALRYKYINSAEITGDNNYGDPTRTSEFDTKSVLFINNFQRFCGIKKSIFKEQFF